MENDIGRRKDKLERGDYLVGVYAELPTCIISLEYIQALGM
jgi:hypothetical protein